ncbi:hypothetical protein WS75_21840 [Burkholderia sp. FL-7-2-10-S1-D7]|uniref:hypothetical protein n=1 Tax=Burkholderia sp. FL-7-2-10-S1-D7 TaxID=1637866 RepID=UPI00075B21D9|nr:hypothetical protein [Burkholderia sp. FL-7-2-10-S1-D7]KVF71610.1 hypothetical protein WS75_21840 [Burkholderia sp. FL-7-2-10-S1-D7]
MSDDIPKRIRRAVKDGRLPNMRDPRHLGYVPPAVGFAHARFVGYFELGIHEEEYEGKKRDREKVDLVFELSGPNHEPTKAADGTLIPIRITAQETLDLSYGASFYELFGAMDAACGGGATHIAEMLGKPFIVEVFRRRSRDGKRIYASLRGPNGYNVKGTAQRDRRTGKPVVVEVAAAVTAVKAFIWEVADKEMWDSIYLPGEYPERRDANGALIAPIRLKNVIQEKIASANNWASHPLSKLGLGPGPQEPLPVRMQRPRKRS